MLRLHLLDIYQYESIKKKLITESLEREKEGRSEILKLYQFCIFQKY